MRFVSKSASTLVITLAMVSAGPAFSSSAESNITADVANGKKIFENGKGDVPACNTCHTATGMGDDAQQTPRIVGLGYAYTVKQLMDFKTNKRKDTTMFIMNTNAAGLEEQDIRDVAAYLTAVYRETNPKLPESTAAQVKEGGLMPFGESHLGKTIALEGNAEKGIPACKSCHGWNGRGRSPMYPAIGHQRYVYLVNQLKKWRAGAGGDTENGRANDYAGQMRAVAAKMSDEDIYNVASYLTRADRTTVGNTRIPGNFATFEKIKVTNLEAVHSAAK